MHTFGFKQTQTFGVIIASSSAPKVGHQKRGNYLRCMAVCIGIFLSLTACTPESPSETPSQQASSSPSSPSKTTETPTSSTPISEALDSPISTCPQGVAKVGSGERKMALIVGVGEYANPRIPDLEGPPNDAQRMYELLTSDKYFGFPKQNVCLLLDADATYDSVTQNLQNFLTDDARKDDVVVIYYAGHGSQIRDRNNDESDGMDETLVLHNSRTGEGVKAVHDLSDDTLNTLIAKLHKKTQNITLVLDSCNSGSASRANSQARVRFFEPESSTTQVDDISSSTTWVPEEMKGLVTLSAAVDGTAALEKNGKGIFTDSLIQVLQQWRGAPPSYQQLVYQAAPLIKTQSYQVVQSNGDLSRTIFGAKKTLFPNTWAVTSVDEGLQLAGAPMPGLDLGAQLRIFDPGLNPVNALKPENSKAAISIIEYDGLRARAEVISRPAGAAAIKSGDVAVLVRPAIPPLSVALRKSSSAGGVPKSQASAIKNVLSKSASYSELIDLSDSGEFELSLSSDGELLLRGPENRVRSRYKKIEDMVDNLSLHAKQRAILQLKGESAGELADNQSLRVSIVPSDKQDRCARQGVWQQAQANSMQIIPLCYRWNIQVKLSDDAPTPLNVGGVILSSDGSIYGFPADGRTERLRPGDTLTFNNISETFRATPPIEVEDTIIVFGTNSENPVAWHQLTQTSRGASNSLQAALNQYVNKPNRGVRQVDDKDNTRSWTRSIVTSRVEANTGFGSDVAKPGKLNFREYTIANFDIRPYMPDDKASPLYKVLVQADQLANKAQSDGISYKQHSWSQSSDLANLALGIDCSRAIWFAFTRAGLVYNNRDNAYLPTADMVTSKTAMNDQFQQCPSDQGFQLGDVLVYRDDKRGDGHVVMVIDPKKRIAWGSHGWDGNSRILPVEPDTGVEYQLIKIKKDWQKWDRSTMTLRNCWRNNAFSELPEVGQSALNDSCSSRECSL